MQATDMLAPGLAKKVTIHLNEDTSSRHDFLYNEIFSFLQERGVAGATMIRPAAGFGSHHRVHTQRAEIPRSGSIFRFASSLSRAKKPPTRCFPRSAN